MYKISLPYYPKLESAASETRFGVLEITHPTIYEQPISGMQLVRVDTLECLRDILGDDCLFARNTTYSIVSGSCDEDTWNARIASYYKNYPPVTAFINSVSEYGDSEEPLGLQVSRKLMERIDSYSKDIMQKFDDAGGKYLISTHLYMYFRFSNVAKVPEVKGMKIIC